MTRILYDKTIVRAKILEIAIEVNKIISNSKATFFVKGKVRIPAKEQLYELKAEISNNVAGYFYELLR